MFRKRNLRNRISMAGIVCIFIFGFAVLMVSCYSSRKPEIYRVGIVHDGGSFVDVLKGFKTKMTDLGYIEGKNIVYDEQNANGDTAEEQRITKKFIDDKVNLIFSFPTPATMVAYAAIQGTDIPLLFAYVGIEDKKLVKNVQKPGGNVTGVRYPGPDTTSKRLEILLSIAPQVKTVWIGYDKNNPNNMFVLDTLRPTAAALGVALVEAPGTVLDELKEDLGVRAKKSEPVIDAIILMPDGFNHTPAGFGLINKFAMDHKIPLGGSFLYTVQQGALFGNSENLVTVGELAAPLADKILKGTNAGTIPVVTPEQDLYINSKVAKELGLQVPEGLLKRANQIIQ
ncbi:MAG: ABC transporter substrate-binding protein [Spirochaetales bacterium]|nr:ABC transporter substrate-binding protein [Spirochaetales bacterium]